MSQRYLIIADDPWGTVTNACVRGVNWVVHKGCLGGRFEAFTLSRKSVFECESTLRSQLPMCPRIKGSRPKGSFPLLLIVLHTHLCVLVIITLFPVMPSQNEVPPSTGFRFDETSSPIKVDVKLSWTMLMG